MALAAGSEAIRTDGFFDPRGSSRSDAEEVAESVQESARTRGEENSLHGAPVRSGGIRLAGQRSAAHQVIKIAEQPSYRQLCILKLAAVKQAFGLRTDYRDHGSGFAKELRQVLCECLDLYHRGLINFGGEVAF